MSRNYRVAVLRARHDRSVPTVSDDLCRKTIIANDQRLAVLQFWTDVTRGYLTFERSQLFPWVDIQIDATSQVERSRQTLYERARHATEQAGHHLGDFDAFFVLAHPGTATIPLVVIPELNTPSTGTVSLDFGESSDDGIGFAVLNTDNDHTTMCHELGHAIGWSHTFGVWNNGSDWDGQPPFTLSREYGDPYDVMSSATFGARWLDPMGPQYGGSPTFALDPPPVAGWPGDAPWKGMGPAPAQAHIHMYAPEALEAAGRVRVVDVPGPGETETAALYAASTPEGNFTTLLVINPPDEQPDGQGRYYIEYRDTSGWDRGLETTGTDLSRRAVVLHRLNHVADGDIACWYQGRILVPIDVDVDAAITHLPLVVRVKEVGPNDAWVTLELARTADRTVFLDRRDNERVLDFVGQRVDSVNTICGPISATWGARKVQTTTVFSVRAYGFGGVNTGTDAPLHAQWTVAGQPVSSTTTNVTVPGEAGRTATVDMKIDDDAGSLTLVSRPDDGHYKIAVSAIVSRANGALATPSENEPYEVDGIRAGYDHTVQQQLTRCIMDILNDLRVRPEEIFVPPVETARPWGADRLQRMKLEGVIARARLKDPVRALELQHLVALRYGAIPAFR